MGLPSADCHSLHLEKSPLAKAGNPFPSRSLYQRSRVLCTGPMLLLEIPAEIAFFLRQGQSGVDNRTNSSLLGNLIFGRRSAARFCAKRRCWLKRWSHGAATWYRETVDARERSVGGLASWAAGKRLHGIGCLWWECNRLGVKRKPIGPSGILENSQVQCSARRTHENAELS